ncbi:response regulator transcription factor [Pseudoclavibacter alba]|uniref:Response regulator transcription factor n=1 Tax=Pseudoclavibacter albus TaxID=272241 RepID=A0ABT2HXK2_9MICO|nr:response regulator transcription factor [Pseudoclavibacter alba]MCT2043034.1 response regulator transcription factor [Pseudoclavibacter alba]
MADTAIRVLLVDDQQLVRTGFRLLLDTEDGIEVVGDAVNGEQAIERVRELHPDVVCMDLQMPVMDGVDATCAITSEPELAASRVLVLTTFRDDESVRAALAAGASGFLVKNAPPETLVEAIRVIHAGEALLDPAVTKSVIAQMRGGSGGWVPQDGGRGESVASTPPVGAAAASAPRAFPAEYERLSDREREVLLGLAEGLSNAAIAKRLWVSDATVKTHVSNVLGKLGLRDRIQAVIYAYEHGIVEPQV